MARPAHRGEGPSTTVAGAALRLFDELVDLDEAQQRAALDLHTRDRPELAKMLQDMLHADRQTRHGIMTGGAEDLIARDLAAQPTSDPSELGPFRVLRRIGAGGMGVVYEAEQDRPRRVVAVKTIHPWLVSERTREWLEEEAHALGAVLHRGIPQVHAVGEDRGVLYVAMELVEGRGLLDACRGRSVRERVRLVRELCDTVAHVHGRGLVHRDLKPANVRVTPEGVPKLLDFGLARPDHAPSDADVVGTLAYMPPEHLAGPAPPDVRADVYAMGVMLFEVLHDHLPEALHDITYDTAMERVSQVRWTVSRTVGASLAGDLTAIVERATAREPRDRFATVDELARELSRALDHEPVRARGGGPLYVAGKLVRRRPGAVLAAAALGVAMLTTTGVAVRASQQAQVYATEQRGLRERADEEAARATAFAGFMERIFLRANPRNATGERTLIEVTRGAGDALDAGELGQHPVERARLRTIVAEALANAGELAGALRHLDAVTAAWQAGTLADGPEVVDAWHGTAVIARRELRLDDALGAIDEAIAVAERAGLSSMAPDLVHSRALIALDAGRRDEARAGLERAVALKRPVYDQLEPQVAVNSLGQLGLVHWYDGDFEQAEALLRESLALCRTLLPPGHVLMGSPLNFLSMVRTSVGDPAEGRALAEEALAIHLDKLDPTNQWVIQDRRELARALLDEDRPAEAEAVLRKTLAAQLGDAWAPTQGDWTTEIWLAEAWARQGRHAEAMGIVEALLAAQPETPDPRWYLAHNEGVVRLGAAEVYAIVGRPQAAHAQATAARQLVLERFGPRAPVVRKADVLLASLSR